jgi:voltage-gated potassium channel
MESILDPKGEVMDRRQLFLQSIDKEKRFDTTKRVIQTIDKIVKPLVIYSVAMLALECHLYPEADSHSSHLFFLWSERFVAGIFTLEYVFRFWRNSGKKYYPMTAFGVIDLIAILPFWIGFIPFFGPHLHLVRTLRVMRMLKFFRYNRSLQLVALSFYRAWWNLKPLLFTTGMIILFSMFALYEVEGHEQPEFRNLFTVAWFLEVTGTTVGYGDLSPQTTAGKLIVMGYSRRRLIQMSILSLSFRRSKRNARRLSSYPRILVLLRPKMRKRKPQPRLMVQMMKTEIKALS